jgi:hypothetical protein
MEKFNHKEFRDGLAQDLKSIPDHKERAEALDSEVGGFRYEKAQELHINDMNAFREQMSFKKREEAINKEIDELPIEQIIESHPELAEIEAIPLSREGRSISLFRVKESPEVAMPIWSQSKHRGGTQGRISIVFSEPRLQEKVARKEFRSTCACCPIETYDVDEPYVSNQPKWPEGDKRDFNLINQEYNEKMEDWRSSEEGENNAEWHEQKKIEFKEVIQKAYLENGIKCLAMRKADQWLKRFGPLDGVEVIEITRTENVYERLGEEWRRSNGKQDSAVFKIRA